MEDKAARRAAILQAANALFAAGGGSLPTAAQIATATHLAKGTVYLYFHTKEEIFAALLLEGWQRVMKESRMVLESTKGSRAVKVERFLAALIAQLERNTELLRLDALSYAVLEKNMLADALIAHKSEYMLHVNETGAVIDRTLDLPSGRGVELLMRTYALTTGLWQSYQHAAETRRATPAVAKEMTKKPFHRELLEALAEYWRGALATKSSSRV